MVRGVGVYQGLVHEKDAQLNEKTSEIGQQAAVIAQQAAEIEQLRVHRRVLAHAHLKHKEDLHVRLPTFHARACLLFSECLLTSVGPKSWAFSFHEYSRLR